MPSTALRLHERDNHGALKHRIFGIEGEEFLSVVVEERLSSAT
jgi:hypothetical protein